MPLISLFQRVLAAALLLTLSHTASAQIVCQPPQYTCQQTSSANVAGFNLVGYCSHEIGTQSCVDRDPLNECRAVEVSVKCTQIEEECVDYVNGQCRQTRYRYSCLNEDNDMSPAILERTEWGPVQEDIVSECGGFENTPECELKSTITTEPAEIRTINRRDFSRAWWRKAREYSCLAPGATDTDCGPLEADPTCQLEEETCLVMSGGTCSNRQYRYKCGVDSSQLQASCEPVNVCAGGNCDGAPPEPADSFGDAAAWLNLLAQMQEEFRSQTSTNPNDVKFFVGEEETCSKAPGRDCCDGSGLFAQCSQANEILWDQRQAGATHYVGSKCQTSVLGACIKRRYYYCTYNGKLARVFIEELKRLKGEGWGPDLLNVDCGFATIEDLNNIDIDQMDLSPVFADMLNQTNIPLQGELKDFYEQRFPTAPSVSQGVYNNRGTP